MSHNSVYAILKSDELEGYKRLVLVTGLHLGEMLGLIWEDVDFRSADEKTFSILLGHYSVAFTMYAYTHVLDGHKWEGMQFMMSFTTSTRHFLPSRSTPSY